jgi:hypothetical protein
MKSLFGKLQKRVMCTFIRMMRMNNFAVTLMRQRNDNDAAKTILRTLELLRETASGFIPSTSELERWRLMGEVVSVVLSNAFVNELCGAVDGVDSSTPAFYSRAMIFSVDSRRIATPTSENLATISMVLLFNAALALQRDGLRTGQSSVVQQALPVYMKIIGILGPLDLHGSHIPDTLKTISLATSVNIAHVHLEFHNRLEAKIWQTHFSVAFQCMERSHMNFDDFAIFAMNAFVFSIEGGVGFLTAAAA